MGDEMRRLDDIVDELDQRRRAEAITEGILGGGHYDSEPAPEDLQRRPLAPTSGSGRSERRPAGDRPRADAPGRDGSGT